MSKPVVDRLERELEGQAQVLRLNVMDKVNGQLAMRYGVRGIPAFILFDGTGKAVWGQVGPPEREKIISLVGQMSSP